jgi:hypothetical protein
MHSRRLGTGKAPQRGGSLENILNGTHSINIFTPNPFDDSGIPPHNDIGKNPDKYF